MPAFLAFALLALAYVLLGIARGIVKFCGSPVRA
jgi:hypothetical protein